MITLRGAESAAVCCRGAGSRPPPAPSFPPPPPRPHSAAPPGLVSAVLRVTGSSSRPSQAPAGQACLCVCGKGAGVHGARFCHLPGGTGSRGLCPGSCLRGGRGRAAGQPVTQEQHAEEQPWAGGLPVLGKQQPRAGARPPCPCHV